MSCPKKKKKERWSGKAKAGAEEERGEGGREKKGRGEGRKEGKKEGKILIKGDD